jgi:hypothetical protein
MRFLRHLTIWLATTLLGTGLSLLLSGWIFNATLADRDVAKNWINSSGIYVGFVDEAVSSSTDEAADSDQTIDPALLLSASNQAFPPDLLQTSTESVLNGVYDWLDGSKDSVEFTLDFTVAKSIYVSTLGIEIQSKVDSLPACSQSQLATIGSIDLFSLECAPPSDVYQPAIAELQQDLLVSDEFLPNPIITAADIELPLNGNQTTVEDALPLAPVIYQLLRAGVVIAVGMIILSIGVLAWITHDKLAVLSKVARSLFIAALTAGIMTGFLYYIAQSASSATLAGDTTFIERITGPLIEVAAHDVLQIARVFTIVYLILAVSFYATYRRIARRRQKDAAT